MRVQRRFIAIHDSRGGNSDYIFLPRNPKDWVEQMVAWVQQTWDISMAINTVAHGVGGCSVAFLSRGSCLDLDDGLGFGFIVPLATLARMRLFLGDGRFECKQSSVRIEADLDIPNQREDDQEWDEDRDRRIFLPTDPDAWVAAMRADIAERGNILMGIENRPDGRCIICFVPQLEGTETFEKALRDGKGFGFIAEPDTVRGMLDLLGLATMYYRG